MNTTPAARPARGTVGLLAAVAVVTLLLDQGTKAIALDRLVEGERVPAIGDLLGWTLIFNPGAALSFGTGHTWVFTIAMVACGIAVITLAPRIVSRPWAIAAGALLGGALGNLVDRLAREPGFAVGHVVDFIDYGVFIGNVADIGIVGAAVGFVVLTLMGRSWDGSTDGDAKGRRPATADDGGAEAESDVTSVPTEQASTTEEGR